MGAVTDSIASAFTDLGNAINDNVFQPVATFMVGAEEKVEEIDKTIASGVESAANTVADAANEVADKIGL
jgi:hypothetical protein